MPPFAPLLLSLRTFGGVPGSFIIAMLALTAATMLIAAQMSILISIRVKRSGTAFFSSMVLIAVLLVLIFFFRGDCAYCHAFAPTLAAFQARYGLRVEAVSVDGGALPGFAEARRDNGIATALRVTQVPAVYLAQPFTGKITPIGFGVLSEAQLLERITAVAAPGYEAMVPSAVRQLGPDLARP